MARLRNVSATSAGGIVVRSLDRDPELVIGMRRREHGVTWTLPKGTPESGETIAETATREVREESGIEVRIVDRLPSIEYDFVQHGARIHKTVHYFLMDPIGGDLSQHDREFADVRWVTFTEAQRLLSFETERALVSTTHARLERLLREEPEASEGRETPEDSVAGEPSVVRQAPTEAGA